jgi:excisionase family DNA binding protein
MILDPDADTLTRLPTFLTVDELASLMRVNRKTVYDAIARGEIPGVQSLGRVIRIHRRTVVDWLRGEARVLRSTRRGP